MKVFISQPMKDHTEEEILDVRGVLFRDYREKNPDAELIDSFLKDYESDAKRERVDFLGESIKLLADADTVIFAPGWEKVPGCRIEERVATYYDIPRIYVR